MKHEGKVSVFKFFKNKAVDMFAIIFDGDPIFPEAYEYHIIFETKDGALNEWELTPELVSFLFTNMLCDYIGYYDDENIMVFGSESKLDLATLPISLNEQLISKYWKLNRFREFMMQYYEQHGRNVNLNSGSVKKIVFNAIGKEDGQFQGVDMLFELPLSLMKYIDILLGIEWTEDRKRILNIIDEPMKDDIIEEYQKWCKQVKFVPKKVR